MTVVKAAAAVLFSLLKTRLLRLFYFNKNRLAGTEKITVPMHVHCFQKSNKAIY